MSLNVISPAERTLDLKYAVRDILAYAEEAKKAGKELIYLNIGDPNIYDFAPPRAMIEASYKAMLENYNGYSPSSGIKSAVDSITREAERKGIKNIQDVFVTTGASEGIEIALNALINAGENMLTPTPGYPLYTAIRAKLQMVENPYYLSEENGWQPDIEDIKSKINDKTKAIIIINPNNPTGSNCKKETLLKLIDVALEHNLVIFADEIYDKLMFDEEEHISIASLNSEVPVITFGGLSKNYMVPGFRIGWGVVSGNRARLNDFIEAINKILRSRLCANHPQQFAIPAALDSNNEHLIEVMQKLTRRRDITVDMLNAVDGISCVKPEGAFYAFPKLDIKDDALFVSKLIKETGVIVVPGSGFGQKPGTSHFRAVFLPQENILEKAYKSIGDFFLKYKNEYEK